MNTPGTRRVSIDRPRVALQAVPPICQQARQCGGGYNSKKVELELTPTGLNRDYICLVCGKRLNDLEDLPNDLAGLDAETE